MRLLYFGDIVGRAGRQFLLARLPQLRDQLAADFVVANGENAAGGFGITPKICADLYEAGVDVITTGNHAWDQREIISYIDSDRRLLRPLNYPAGTPGSGVGIFEIEGGRAVMVAQVIGRLFMEPLDDPFAALDRELDKVEIGGTVDAVIVDLHCDATSESMALGHFVDGRASLAIGSHTHVPTADAQILLGGTAYQTDAGMCGDYDSVIGMKKEAPIARFTRKLPTERLEPATGAATLCAVFVETDDRTGLATSIAPLRTGGRLAAAWPL